MSISLEQAVVEYGFKDTKEFHHLVAMVDISTPEKAARFKEWQYNDGTKEGLLKLPQREEA